MNQDLLRVALPTVGALAGALIGALVSYAGVRRADRLARTKLIASWKRSEELEKTRIASYVELWKCLGAMSTHNSAQEIVANLTVTQDRLHEWYYGRGGGLLIAGAGNDPESSKSAFFAARELRSTDPYQIWNTFHHLRRSIRRDLDVFETEEDETAALQKARKKYAMYST